jgi:hypothetical protein
VYPDEEWMSVLRERVEDKYDVVPVHSYAESWERETAVEKWLDNEGYHKWFLPLVKPKPIWLNEIGMPTFLPQETIEGRLTFLFAFTFSSGLLSPNSP